MALLNVDSNAIEKKAETLLKDSGLFNVAVNVEKLASRLDITVLRKDLDEEVSGFLIHKDGRTTIAVNVNHVGKRQRFTIAHEIGHFRQHIEIGKNELFVDKVKFFRNEASSDGEHQKEIEANKFAAALLMPRELVHKEISLLDNETSLDDQIISLADKFEVSRPAMGFRLVNLGYLTRYTPDYQ